MECQNGHKGVVLITQFSGGEIVRQRYFGTPCKCPKDEIGEGYAPAGDDIVMSITNEFSTL